MAKSMSLPLLGEQIDGIWHTGIVVHGKEYYYGSGISYDLPGQTPFGSPVKTLDLGQTKISEAEFMKKLKELREEWSSQKYDLFEHNCNHFTNVCAKHLLGKGIP
jgi:desumoylating isopeptidase 1